MPGIHTGGCPAAAAPQTPEVCIQSHCQGTHGRKTLRAGFRDSSLGRSQGRSGCESPISSSASSHSRIHLCECQGFGMILGSVPIWDTMTNIPQINTYTRRQKRKKPKENPSVQSPGVRRRERVNCAYRSCKGPTMADAGDAWGKWQERWLALLRATGTSGGAAHSVRCAHPCQVQNRW